MSKHSPASYTAASSQTRPTATSKTSPKSSIPPAHKRTAGLALSRREEEGVLPVRRRRATKRELIRRSATGLGNKPLVRSCPMTQEQMLKRLEENYPACKIEVFDLTGTQDHWEVYVESSKFAGLTRIQQHQQVMGCFGPELKTGEVHALSIKTKII